MYFKITQTRDATTLVAHDDDGMQAVVLFAEGRTRLFAKDETGKLRELTEVNLPASAPPQLKVD